MSGNVKLFNSRIINAYGLSVFLEFRSSEVRMLNFNSGEAGGEEFHSVFLAAIRCEYDIDCSFFTYKTKLVEYMLMKEN